MKKLVKEFSDYLFETEMYDRIDMAASQFWVARFGCNNEAKQAQLIDLYRSM